MTKQSTLPVSVQNNAPPVADVLAAFFAAVTDKGLATLSLADVAAEADIAVTLLRRHYPSIGHIVMAFNDYVSAEMQDAISYDSQDSKRDIYFELIMARLDALQAYREGVVAFYADLPRRPDLALIQLRHAGQAVHTMIEAADDFYPAWQIGLKKAGLMGLYARALHSWRNDDTPDLSKTMAQLDKWLEQAEYWASRAQNALPQG
jgi:AcrR family transcriptional regulator